MCADPDTEGRWQPHVTVCYATAAADEFHKRHKDIERSHLVHFSLVAPDQEIDDPLTFSPERAAREYAEHMARFADSTPGG